MILMKIEDGKLVTNWDEIVAQAEAFDRGCKSEDAYKAKLIQLVWNDGFDAAREEIEKHMQTALLLSCTGGHA
jgi:hypothetical protein